MKTLMLLLLGFLLSFSAYSIHSTKKIEKSESLEQVEINNILNQVLDVEEKKLISQLKKKNRIIIMDENFNKIREVYLGDKERVSDQPMLQPFMYLSEFITKVHNVSYYVLEKK